MEPWRAIPQSCVLGGTDRTVARWTVSSRPVSASRDVLVSIPLEQVFNVVFQFTDADGATLQQRYGFAIVP